MPLPLPDARLQRNLRCGRRLLHQQRLRWPQDLPTPHVPLPVRFAGLQRRLPRMLRRRRLPQQPGLPEQHLRLPAQQAEELRRRLHRGGPTVPVAPAAHASRRPPRPPPRANVRAVGRTVDSTPASSNREPVATREAEFAMRRPTLWLLALPLLGPDPVRGASPPPSPTPAPAPRRHAPGCGSLCRRRSFHRRGGPARWRTGHRTADSTRRPGNG